MPQYHNWQAYSSHFQSLLITLLYPGLQFWVMLCIFYQLAKKKKKKKKKKKNTHTYYHRMDNKCSFVWGLCLKMQFCLGVRSKKFSCRSSNPGYKLPPYQNNCFDAFKLHCAIPSLCQRHLTLYNQPRPRAPKARDCNRECEARGRAQLRNSTTASEGSAIYKT